MEFKERLADLCHKQWSGWMKYLFSKCEANIINGEPVTVIPNWAVDRWTRQLETDYSGLSEEEQNSDRKEADKFIKLFKEARKGYVELKKVEDVLEKAIKSECDCSKCLAEKALEEIKALR